MPQRHKIHDVKQSVFISFWGIYYAFALFFEVNLCKMCVALARKSSLKSTKMQCYLLQNAVQSPTKRSAISCKTQCYLLQNAIEFAVKSAFNLRLKVATA